MWSSDCKLNNIPVIIGADAAAVLDYFFNRQGITATRAVCQIVYGRVRSMLLTMGIEPVFFPLGGQPAKKDAKLSGAWAKQFKPHRWMA